MADSYKKCKTCGGQGTWQEREETAAGDVTIVQRYCNSCNGTGYIIPAEAQDDYDIGGDSLNDDDD